MCGAPVPECKILDLRGSIRSLADLVCRHRACACDIGTQGRDIKVAIMHFNSISAEAIDTQVIRSDVNIINEHDGSKGLDYIKNPGERYSASGLVWIFPGDDTKVKAPKLATAFFKRVMDLALSGMAVIFLSPVFVLLSLAVVVTSKGPVFFIQHRPGKNGVMFPMLKFRSMQQGLGDATGVTQTVHNDMRLTPIGKFIRKTSLDELPQLLNVLLGHMSLVGPRPHPLGMKAAGVDYTELVPYYDLRHSVQPGLSGWAQVNGLRGPTIDAAPSIARIDHDIAYIQNRTLSLDLKIIMRTLRQELSGGSGL